MICSQCGKELKSGWKICPYCQTAISSANTCPECGEEVEPDWEACPFCGTKLKKPKKDIGFNFDELDELNDAFDKQLQEEENLNRANILCVRGEYDRALKLYEDYIDKHYDRIEGYIGVVRVYSHDYTIYEGEKIDNAVRSVERLFKKAQITDGEYNNYISSKKKYSADKKVKDAEAAAKKRAEEAEKKRAAEEAAKKLAEEEAAKKRASAAAKKRAEEAEKKREAEEAAKRLAAAEAAKKRASAASKKLAEEEAAKRRIAAETAGMSQLVRKFYLKAINGDAKAQFNLGWYYANGQGVNQDYNKAIYWYTKSAEQGNANAQNNLGDCYYYGNGVAQDYKQAVYWYTKAAEQGLATAQCNLGSCYYYGDGVAKNPNEALRLFKASADRGSPEGRQNYEWLKKQI